MKTYRSNNTEGALGFGCKAVKPAKGGFRPGCRFTVRQDEQKMLILTLNEDGGASSPGRVGAMPRYR